MDQGVRKGAKQMETTKKERLCYIRPVRALRRMKNADEDGQTVYIFGVTGIGKTELFTRYLDGREYRLLNGRKIDPEALKPKKKETRQIIVIDDLHDLVFDPNQEEIKEQITKLAVREDIWLILAGRSPVPPWLAPIRYREMFCIINEERLLFDERMAEQYVSRRNMLLTEKQLAVMKAYCHGVAVGWQVSSDAYDRFRQLKKDPSGPFDEQEFEILIENAKDQMWDYLEYHVYDQWEVQLQEFSITANQPSLMNGEKDFCDWSFRDVEIMRSMEKILEGIFGSYGKGLTNLAIAESMFEKGGDNYEVAMLANKGRMQAAGSSSVS